MKNRNKGFTPLEKAADFNRRSLLRKADGGLMPSSSQPVSPPAVRLLADSLTGFTIIEVLTVLAVISLLIGVLLPALNMARNAARVAKQKVQLASIEEALFAFRNDYGEYPPSEVVPATTVYGGAQKLAEALVGLDLLGFHRLSGWTADGKNLNLPPGQQQVYITGDTANVAARRPRYLALENANAFKIGQIYDTPIRLGSLAPDTYVLCDEFARPQVQVTIGTKSYNVGTPILYYRANPSGLGLFPAAPNAIPIYTCDDNAELVMRSNILVGSNLPGLADEENGFIPYITDPKVTGTAYGSWPYRPDSFILISAGLDGLYGTADDITNFRN